MVSVTNKYGNIMTRFEELGATNSYFQTKNLKEGNMINCIMYPIQQHIGIDLDEGFSS